MTIELKSPRNTKGPISAYRIALTDTSQSSFLSKDRSSTWKDVMNIGYSYYVAAELTPEVSYYCLYCPYNKHLLVPQGNSTKWTKIYCWGWEKLWWIL